MIDALDQMRARRHRSPFVPFLIALIDGRRIPTTRPLQSAFNEKIVIVLDDRDLSTRFKPAEIAGFEDLHQVAQHS